MELNIYQQLALQTKQTQRKDGDGLIVSLLGLACEATGPLSEFKKHIRDGDAHKLYNGRMREEFGDILWYLASAANAFDLTLDEIASANLKKTQDRWGKGSQRTLAIDCFDNNFPEDERIPKHFVIRFLSFTEGDRKLVRTYWGLDQMGQALTDNAHNNDGYRFHDIFHLACAAVLGWSPVVRRNLGLKRRSNAKVDEIEDGGRAIVIEEAISALVFDYALSHDMLANISTVDYELLRTIKTLAEHFEVKVKTASDWESTILQAYSAWRQLAVKGEGYAICNVSDRKIFYSTDDLSNKSDINASDLPGSSSPPVEV